tara:strand:+ start:963 stop:1502 length:540 start_codon:yes stop_codon:yes gene_type:complete
MNIRSNCEVWISHHPHAESLNKKIMEEIKELEFINSYKTNVHAQMTEWDTFSPILNQLREWVRSTIFNKFIIKDPDLRIHIQNLWVARYNKGDYTWRHNHKSSWMSYVYFVKCPKGSSPLIFNNSFIPSFGKEIKAEEGKLLIFPGILDHWVPKNKCDNRVVIAGNANSYFENNKKVKY